MDTEIIDLLNSLHGIAVVKSEFIPLRYRGYANSSGLYIQEQNMEGRIRLRAGGMFSPCIDATRDENGEWFVNKFDRSAWQHRFAAKVQLLGDIVDFIEERLNPNDELDNEAILHLQKAIDFFKTGGVWHGLPQVQKSKLKPSEGISGDSESEPRDKMGKDERLDTKPEGLWHNCMTGLTIDPKIVLEEYLVELEKCDLDWKSDFESGSWSTLLRKAHCKALLLEWSDSTRG